MEQLEVKIGIPYQEFAYLIIDALESGSNYWYWLDAKDIPVTEAYPGLSPSERIAKKVWEGGTVPVYDLENQDEKLGDLNLEGIKKQFEESPDREQMINAYMQCWAGNGDAGDADIFFQIAVMGEVTFG